ncbi:MAG: Smr/MutS family protein [Desulfobacteraceae bacterium]
MEPVAVPIDGTLDLHTFNPKELSSLVPEYLWACRQKGILSVRIIHGKGKGVQKARVHAILARSPLVKQFNSAAENAGGWGATLVELKPGESPAP